MGQLQKSFKSRLVETIFVGVAFLQAAQVQAAPTPPPKKAEPTEESILRSLPDMTADAIAGEWVEMTLVFKDALTQESKPQKIRVKIPERKFKNPAAKNLVSLRKALMKNTKDASAVAAGITAVLNKNAKDITNPDRVTMLNDIRSRIASSKDPVVLQQAVDDLWSAMLLLDQDSMTTGEKQLEAAKEGLRESSAKKINDEELRKRLEEAAKAIKESLKEQKEYADKKKDAKSAQSLEQMKSMADELKKLLEQVPKPTQEMAKQMREQLEKTQQMQQAQKDGEPQKSQEQMRQQAQKSMQQMMQQMKQQAQKMQQMKQLQKDLQDMVKKQQEIAKESIKSGEAQKADLAKIQEQLEKLAGMLDQKVDEKTVEKSDEKEKANEDFYEQQNKLSQELDDKGIPAEEKQKIMNEAGRELREKAAQAEIYLDNLWVWKNITEDALKFLKNKRNYGLQITRPEAEDLSEKLAKVQQGLQEQKEQEQKQGQPQNESQQQQDQQDKQQQDELSQKIQDMMKKLQQESKDKNKELSERQKDLQKKLEEATKKLEKDGKDASKLKDAEKSMKKSADSLDEGEPDESVPSQNDAIQSMSAAAQDAQKAMEKITQKGPGGGKGEGEGEGKGEGKGEGEGESEGRASEIDSRFGHSDDDANIDPSQQKNMTREIRDEIRKRLEDPKLPKATRDYLQRLLKDAPQSQPPKPAP